MRPRVAGDFAKQGEALSLVETTRLEAEGIEPDADAAPSPRLGQSHIQQSRAQILSASGLRHEEQLDE